MKEFAYVWNWLTRLPARKGKRCRIVGKNKNGMLLIEFEDDGFRTTCLPQAIRLVGAKQSDAQLELKL